MLNLNRGVVTLIFRLASAVPTCMVGACVRSSSDDFIIRDILVEL